MNKTDVLPPLLPTWTLVSSHGAVLFFVALHPDVTMKETADQLSLTERRVSDILRDLRTSGLLLVTRVGRRNLYSLAPQANFRYPFLSHLSVRSFLQLLEYATNDKRWGDMFESFPALVE